MSARRAASAVESFSLEDCRSHSADSEEHNRGDSNRACFIKHRDINLIRSKRFQAVISMSCSLAIHLGGYELSRASVMALFTSDGLGFGKSSSSNSEGGLSALPMAVGFVSPFSIALLWFYGKTLSHGGPRYALRVHTMICAAAQIMCGLILGSLNQLIRMKTNENAETIVRGLLFGVKEPSTFSKPILFIIFVFQNAYVQLIYNQHWAFISSVLTAEEGTKAFAPIAGLGSIGSTLAAGMVSKLIERSGLIGLLYMAGAALIVSALLADLAFRMARNNGFEPDAKDASASDRAASTSTNTYECCKKNIFQQAHTLFQRVPVLGALFSEVIISQCLSSLINYISHRRPTDLHRRHQLTPADATIVVLTPSSLYIAIDCLKREGAAGPRGETGRCWRVSVMCSLAPRW